MFSYFSIFLFLFSIFSSVFNNNIHYFSFSLKKDMCKEIFKYKKKTFLLFKIKVPAVWKCQENVLKPFFER